MADEKCFSDGYVDVILIRQNQLTDPTAPSVTELNSNGINISNAIAWEGTTWPTNTDSNDTDDRSIKDVGNASSRGYAQYEAVLNLFYPKVLTDTTSDYGKAYQFFKDSSARVPVYIVTRILQTTANAVTAVVAGDVVSVFKLGTDAFVTDTEGEDSYKYAINFLPQGGVWPYTQAVTTKAALTVTAPDGLPTAVGMSKALRAVYNSKRVTNQATWSSSNLAVATVSPNGVVTGVAAGTADITAIIPSSLVSVAQAVTIV
ncbi:MAG: Ig-like domain-containing protein [Candidatus Paceibacterota bacterium]|jgi:hypothetical protein